MPSSLRAPPDASLPVDVFPDLRMLLADRASQFAFMDFLRVLPGWLLLPLTMLDNPLRRIADKLNVPELSLDLTFLQMNGCALARLTQRFWQFKVKR